MIKIYMVKTDSVCFITDCIATDGYNHEYHRSKIDSLLFNGEKAKVTFSPNWLQIEKYPQKIQQYVSVPNTNVRYEIKNKNLISDVLPEIILNVDSKNFDDDIFSLYEYKYDTQKAILQDVECEIDIVFEVENFEMPPVIDYAAFKKCEYETKQMNITNADIKHQLFDKMIFPAIMLHTRPCSISSHNLYCLIRQHIKDNIDCSVARITSDYDFCFTVKKLIPLLEPETISYSNILARTKKERNKIHYKVKEFKETEIFEMTHDQSKYKGYTVIDPIIADNEVDLKNKIDEFLKYLIDIINMPLQICEHCDGTGYKDEFKKIRNYRTNY